MEKTLTQKQRLNEYQKFIDSNIIDTNGRLNYGLMDMIYLHIDEIDDEEWSNWENGDCELVNEMIVKSVLKQYLKK
tara:strand:+ start:826 stop:1053 length:228 start_codon:yes stop_codon:yes gene_type:complete